MKGILTQVFVTLGVLFLIVILFALYFFITDPFNIKPMLFGTPGTGSTQTERTTTASDSTGDSTATSASATPASPGFVLSDAQKQALISFGINPDVVPSSLSPEQEACFVSVLGEARVAEVKNGAVPNAFEFYKAKSCV